MIAMNEQDYEFTLKISLPNANDDPEKYVEGLLQAGCSDALIGVGKRGRMALDFTRSAESAAHAIISALEDVFRAIPHARLIEAGPDLVGISEAAEIAGFTRQNMRELMLADPLTAPNPVHESASGLYHLVKVLTWLRDRKRRSVDEKVLEVAFWAMKLNIAKEVNELPNQKVDDELLAALAT